MIQQAKLMKDSQSGRSQSDASTNIHSNFIAALENGEIYACFVQSVRGRQSYWTYLKELVYKLEHSTIYCS